MMPRNIPKPGATMNDAISIEGFRFPADRHYDREHHLWAMAEPDGACILVGLDALSLASLGDLAYVAVSEPGTEVARGESIGTLEAAKITGEIFAPLGGVVRRRNEPALRDPSLVNADGYGCWLVAIEPSGWESDAAGMASGEDLEAWVREEIIRYREEGWID